jgi:tRNA U34 5-carboxymethylaminomethyl modifying GTPase MnmE/TrmE
MFSYSSLSSSLVASVWTRTKRQQQQLNNKLQQKNNNNNKKTTTRIHLFGKPNTGESATKESLEYELEKANKWRDELGEELREAKKERDQAVESLDLYKRRLKEAEKDVFKLEKLTLEQEQKFNAFEIVVKNQIKLLERMVKERDEQLAKTQPPKE